MGLLGLAKFDYYDADGGFNGAQVSLAWSWLLSGDDVITRTEGSDREGLFGVNAGNDGFAGGADRFVWDLRSELGGGDVITDFTARAGVEQDRLMLGVTNWGGSTTLTLVNGASATSAVESFVCNAANRTLYWHADGTGAEAALAVVRLTGVATLTAANFDLY